MIKKAINKVSISIVIAFVIIKILDFFGQYNYLSFIGGVIAANIYIYLYERIEDK